MNIRSAALLHDIGHCLFSHSSEEIYQYFPEILELTRTGGQYEGVKPHEILSCLVLLSEPFQTFISRVNAKYYQSLDVNRMAAAIKGRGAPEHQFETDILNGSFDVDKLDYVVRDGRLIGLPVAVDLHRLFTAMDISLDATGNCRKLTIDLRGEITLEQIVFGKMILFTSVYQHHKARACDCLLKGIFEYVHENRGAGILVGGRQVESPADFLWWTDDILAAEGHRLKQDHPILHELMHGLAYRRLPKRALVLSRDLMKSNNDVKMGDFLELRRNKPRHREQMRKLAERIIEKSGVPCSKQSVWLDLPKPPALKEGQETVIRKPDGTLCKLNDLFGIDQWAEHYDQHKWSGHVFGPEEHIDAISSAAREVLKEEYDIDLDPVSWQLCHLF